MFREFLNLNKQQTQSGLFDFFNRVPHIQLDGLAYEEFDKLNSLLLREAEREPFSRLIIQYLSALLLKANHPGRAVEKTVIKLYPQDRLRRLMMLIDEHYRVHRETLFYSKALGMPPRKLNGLTKKLWGNWYRKLSVIVCFHKVSCCLQYTYAHERDSS